jgi:hypothetical protein
MSRRFKSAFRPKRVSLPIDRLVGSRTFEPRERNQEKYRQIAASIALVGVIEPLVVFPVGGGKHRILDGHRRYDVLLHRGEKTAPCIIANEDESYTYNRRANYLSPVAEHRMILRALKHTSEERVAAALNVDISVVRQKRDLLLGICSEAAEILKDERASSRAFAVLKKMRPVRQVEAAQLMVASKVYSGRFALALLAGTRDEMLVRPEKDRSKRCLSPDERLRLEQETENLLKDLKNVEASYGTDVLSFTVSCRYVEKLLGSARVRYELESRYPEILHELTSLLRAMESENGIKVQNTPTP